MHTGHTALLLLAAHAHLHAHSRPHPRPVVGSSTARHFVAATFEPQRRARYSLLCMCVTGVCVQWTPQVDKQLFYFPPCLCALFALFCCLFLLLFLLLLLQASFFSSSSPPLLPLSRLYVRRACVYFLFLLSRIFMQSAALHFLTLQLLFAFRFVLFSVCVCPVFVCALCVYAMRRFVVSFNCTDTSLILSCSFQLLLFSSCSSSSYCSCCSCCSCCCCYRISCRRFALVCTRQQPSQSQQRRNFEFGRCVGPPTAAAATLTLTPQQLKLRSSLACLIA